jgi:hypothetical protein
MVKVGGVEPGRLGETEKNGGEKRAIPERPPARFFDEVHIHF